MKQLIQNYKSGDLKLVEVPAPPLKKRCILVQTCSSLVSVGTERAMLALAKKSLLGKALARPDLVKRVINKARTDGLGEAYRQARGRLDTPVPLGYSASGRVVGVGEEVKGFSEGDRVACAGSGHASHAEMLCVPQTLAVKMPEATDFDGAAFVALGSIALHAIRLAGLDAGGHVAVLGLGLLGQLAVQILNGAGCRVCGLDIDPQKMELALSHGAQAGGVIDRDDVPNLIRSFTDGRGVDAVIIFASTDSNGPIELAAEIAREHARIVAPGLVGLNIPRKLFYEKELRFQVSRAWGPGIYDPDYEAGKDYPDASVRWTAGRNMAHFLELVRDGKVRVDHLITHRFSFEQAREAYDLILKKKEPVIGVLLNYAQSGTGAIFAKRIFLQDQRAAAVSAGSAVSVGLIGAGQFARGTLLPALKEIPGVELRGVCTSTGPSGEHIAKKNGFQYCSTDPSEILNDEKTNLVLILTRHGSHAKWVCAGLQAGKSVFVEKPLCINEAQLTEIIRAYSERRALTSGPPFLMVGLNRRFAPSTQETVRAFSRIPRPLMVAVRVNVGPIPKESWVHDAEDGGGNIIGEVCHFIDLIQVITGAFPVGVHAEPIRGVQQGIIPEDNATITVTMTDGSVGTIHYTTLGNKAFERERIEVFGGGRIAVNENFRRLSISPSDGRRNLGRWLRGTDKGHRAEMAELIAAVKDGKPSPVPFESYVATTRATFAAVESIRSGKAVGIDLSI